jgi:hypothetical protein
MRQKFVDDLRSNFAELQLNYSIGGQISIDIFPQCAVAFSFPAGQRFLCFDLSIMSNWMSSGGGTRRIA